MFGVWLGGEADCMEKGPIEISLANTDRAGWEWSATKAFWMEEERSGYSECSSSVADEVGWHNGKIKDHGI